MEEASISATSLPNPPKRSRPDDDPPSPWASTASISLPSGQTNGTSIDSLHVPAFLLQSKAEIHQQFEELEWRSRLRGAEGHSSPATSKWALETDFEILSRNRYMNVQPFKHSRIHLKVPEGQCDYINASPITVKNSKTKEETKYIATQGPKTNQFNHFWQMVWESTEDVAVIVMLTQVSEGGREKCATYFPLDMDQDTLTIDDQDPVTHHAPATIKLLEMRYDNTTHSMVRKLELTFEGETKPVWHFLYTNWPDFGVPEGSEREGLLNLLNASSEKNSNPLNPRIIHCSAGVGRSGTFIALDHLLREHRDNNLSNIPEGVDPVFDTVNRLREQRMMMVQSESQFNFIYTILKDQFHTRPGSSGGSGSRLLVSTTMDGASDSLDERSPKMAKIAADLDAEIAGSVVVSDEAPSTVFNEVNGNASKEKANSVEGASTDTIETKL